VQRTVGYQLSLMCGSGVGTLRFPTQYVIYFNHEHREDAVAIRGGSL